MGTRKLGFQFIAYNDERDAERPQEERGHTFNGYTVGVGMEGMGGDTNLVLSIRQGMSPAVASDLLREFADLIERDGQKLLNLDYHHKGGGTLRDDGSVEWWDDLFGESDGNIPNVV